MKEVAGITFTQTIKLRFAGSWDALPVKSAWHWRTEENYNVKAAGRLASMIPARGGEGKMAEYIDREKAIALIEEKQKELCPVGRYGRNYVYGSDREKYDSWDEIIDQLENIETADVAPVVHGKWILGKVDYGFSPLINGIVEFPNYTCSNCGYETGTQAREFVCCPKCTAKMGL